MTTTKESAVIPTMQLPAELIERVIERLLKAHIFSLFTELSHAAQQSTPAPGTGADKVTDERALFAKFAKRRGYPSAGAMHPTAWEAWKERAALAVGDLRAALAARQAPAEEQAAMQASVAPSSQEKP